MTKLEQMCEPKSSHYRSNKLELAARQLLDCFEGGLIDLNAVTTLREALDHSGEANEMVQEPMKECRHCGFLCKPNPNESGKWYPLEQAEQEPVGYFAYDEEHDIWEELTGPNAPGATKLYAAPVSIALQSETDSSSSSMRTTVRTKDHCNPLQDLTDDEIAELPNFDGVPIGKRQRIGFARAVIAKDREKNK